MNDIFRTNDRVCKKSNTTRSTIGGGTAFPSGAPEFTPVFRGVRVARSLVFCVVKHRCLSFCPFSILVILQVTFKYICTHHRMRRRRCRLGSSLLTSMTGQQNSRNIRMSQKISHKLNGGKLQSSSNGMDSNI